MPAITSRENERVKHAVRLAASARLRAEEGLFFAEGLRLCKDLAQNLRVHSLFATQPVWNAHPELAQIPCAQYLVNDSVAQKLGDAKSPQGLFALFCTPQAGFDALQGENGLLLCEKIQDPANLGAMLRSAAGLGLGGALLTPGCADPYAPKALRAGMGAVGRLPVLCGQALSAVLPRLRGAAAVYAATSHGAAPLGKIALRSPFVLMVGNEGAGLSEEALQSADERLAIPMHSGVESLNAAAAAAIILYEMKRSAVNASD